MVKCDLKSLLSIAQEAVQISGKKLKSRKALLVKIDFENRRDVKIAADKLSEKKIIKFLRQKTDFSIVSEECGIVKGRNKEYAWIVDPLDGTLNYSRGLPISCVSVGLWKNNLPVLGAVYDFNRDEIFSGITGKAAWLNGSRIKVSGVNRRQKAILCTGFPANTGFSVKNISRSINYIRSYKKVRLLGSAALSIVYVACGRADAYREEDIMLWDIAGALPVLSGAGGKSELKKSSKVNSFNVVVSNGCFKKG